LQNKDGSLKCFFNLAEKLDMAVVSSGIFQSRKIRFALFANFERAFREPDKETRAQGDSMSFVRERRE
jgi:hypothetical protein